MVVITKKRAIAISVVIVTVLAIAFPLTAYAQPISDGNIAQTRTLDAKGVARVAVDGQTVRLPANFTLTLEKAGGHNPVPRFNVVGGAVTVDGEVYTISSGTGGVLRGRHLILLKADGTSPDGRAVTLKLAGRYFWMGGRLYVARIGARLLTPNGNYTMLLRAGIRV
jgi:hypothetical protein